VRLFVVTLCLVAGNCAVAQTSSEVTRIRDAQGVEILSNRKAADVPLGDGRSIQSTRSLTVTSDQGSAAKSAKAPSHQPSSFRVDPSVQAERDRERQRILLSELQDEGRKLTAKRRALDNPRLAFDLSSEQQQALRDSVQRHEENIKALNRELAPSRMASKDVHSREAY
jgi:hypothetical protein